MTILAQVNKKTGTVTGLHFTESVVNNGIICLQVRGIIINENICKCVCVSLSIFFCLAREPGGQIC